MEKRGSGGTAPSKLKSSAEGRFANKVRKPCRRHGLKLVQYCNEPIVPAKLRKKDPATRAMFITLVSYNVSASDLRSSWHVAPLDELGPRVPALVSASGCQN